MLNTPTSFTTFVLRNKIMQTCISWFIKLLTIIQWTRQFRVIDSSGSSSHFPKSISCLKFVVGCQILIYWRRDHETLDYTASLERENVYIPLLKHSFKAIISAKQVLFIYRFVENLPLTNILKMFFILSIFFISYLLIVWPSPHTTVPGQS